jgi:hypothetical protein
MEVHLRRSSLCADNGVLGQTDKNVNYDSVVSLWTRAAARDAGGNQLARIDAKPLAPRA